MPTNLKDYMNKNNITNSSKGSFEYKRYNESERDQHESRHNQQFNKFSKSKNQCIEELNQILIELQRKDGELKKTADAHNNNVIKKFNEQYDTIAQQILRQVELHLRDNKQKYLKEIKERRSVEMAECKPIRRNVEKLKEEITTLREGLYRQNQYRQYISKIVLKDYENELNYVQNDINRIRLPALQVKMDDKYYSCFKSDLDKLIIIVDEIGNRSFDHHNTQYSQSYQHQSQHQPQHQSEKPPQPPMRYEDINSHSNRDQIKRTALSKYN